MKLGMSNKARVFHWIPDSKKAVTLCNQPIKILLFAPARYMPEKICHSCATYKQRLEIMKALAE